ncbi:glycosyl hydrolase family 8 [Luedemannella flava]
MNPTKQPTRRGATGAHRRRQVWLARSSGLGVAAAVVPVVCAFAAVNASGHGLAHRPDLNAAPPTGDGAAGPRVPTAPGVTTVPEPRPARTAPAVPFGVTAGPTRPACSPSRATGPTWTVRWSPSTASGGRLSCGPAAGGSTWSRPTPRYPVVAEAQGYGLVISALMAGADRRARELFDGILGYVLAHPSSQDRGLMAAEQDADCRDVNGGDSATDGDLDIAYGLLLADRQWGSNGRYDYRRLALRRIAAIARSEVDPRTHLLRLGDWASGDGRWRAPVARPTGCSTTCGRSAAPPATPTGTRSAAPTSARCRACSSAPAPAPDWCPTSSSTRTRACAPRQAGCWRASTTGSTPGMPVGCRCGWAPTR